MTVSMPPILPTIAVCNEATGFLRVFEGSYGISAGFGAEATGFLRVFRGSYGIFTGFWLRKCELLRGFYGFLDCFCNVETKKAIRRRLARILLPRRVQKCAKKLSQVSAKPGPSLRRELGAREGPLQYDSFNATNIADDCSLQ